jgi:glucose-1-phosphate cytidylyltransferase
MKAVILAGGLGSRLSEETVVKPKPMVEIGGKPILWHIMKIYSAHGINDFIICLGYKGYLIKEYFANYLLHTSNVTISPAKGMIEFHETTAEPWRITLVDTGEDTNSGGRLKRVRNYIGNETFCFTYGDGVGDINITELIKYHKSHGKKATVTGVQAPGRFGSLKIEGAQVVNFSEKPLGDGLWINGGFFVLEPAAIDYVPGDHAQWEHEPIQGLTADKELVAYKHHGAWFAMDTLRDKNQLDSMWRSGNAPWKVWS